MLGQKIAEKYGLRLTKYDYSKRTNKRIPDHRPVFSVIIPNTKVECECRLEHLITARKELRKMFEDAAIRIFGFCEEEGK